MIETSVARPRDGGARDRASVAQRTFLAAFALLCLAKLLIATRLPLFVDEAFYWQEGQHLAWAYSDLPGLTAWLARLGTLLGDHPLALRLPFLLLGACLPWLVWRIARREYGEALAWQAALLALLLPLAGTLGLLALPDVPMTVAALLCLDAGTRLLRGVTAGACVELALGLAMGALSHYRFVAVIAAGGLALLALPAGRAALRDPRVWVGIYVGVLAWLPLLQWNLAHADAGLRFQLVDRHPWTFSSEGLALGAAQVLVATPLLAVAATLGAWRARHDAQPGRRWLALAGGILVAGFLLLGFFADRERTSFHWTLQGWLALLPLAAAMLAGWSRGWRIATWSMLVLGVLLALGYHAAAAMPKARSALIGSKAYPVNFIGWPELAQAVREELAAMPPQAQVLAGDFKLGAQLGFALRDPRIAVLEHPLNAKHGRAPQLALWGLARPRLAADAGTPKLLVVAPDDVRYRDLLAHYHQLCTQVGPSPPPRTVLVDHGAQRFLLMRLPPTRGQGACVTPAMAWIDAPASGARVPRRFQVRGWAFKDGAGIARVDVTLDGRVVAQARYGEDSPGTAHFWQISTDPNHPRVGYSAEVEAAPGRYWLGLVLHGADGSVEPWPQQRLVVE